MSFRLPGFLMVGLPVCFWLFFFFLPLLFPDGSLLGEGRTEQAGKGLCAGFFISSGKTTTWFPVMLSEIPHFP